MNSTSGVKKNLQRMTNEGYMLRQGFLLVTIESESEWLDIVDIVIQPLIVANTCQDVPLMITIK